MVLVTEPQWDHILLQPEMLGEDAHLPQDGIQALQKHVPQVPSCNSWCFSAFSCGAIPGSLLCTPPESSQLPPTTSPAGATAYTHSWNWATGPQSRRWPPSWTPFQREHLGWAPCQPVCMPRWPSSASGAWQTVLIPTAGLSHPGALRTWFHLLNFTVLKWTGQDPEEPLWVAPHSGSCMAVGLESLSQLVVLGPVQLEVHSIVIPSQKSYGGEHEESPNISKLGPTCNPIPGPLEGPWKLSHVQGSTHLGLSPPDLSPLAGMRRQSLKAGVWPWGRWASQARGLIIEVLLHSRYVLMRWHGSANRMYFEIL